LRPIEPTSSEIRTAQTEIRGWLKQNAAGRPQADREDIEAEAIARIAFDKIDTAGIFAPLPPVNWLVQGLDICAGPPVLTAGYGYSKKFAPSKPKLTEETNLVARLQLPGQSHLDRVRRIDDTLHGSEFAEFVVLCCGKDEQRPSLEALRRLAPFVHPASPTPQLG
jgi:hypothetical protein